MGHGWREPDLYRHGSCLHGLPWVSPSIATNSILKIAILAFLSGLAIRVELLCVLGY
ncbi:hypothetical protein TRIP_E110049 [uncultured Spirochaetota bacterium]|uniref:Uncharacterized protein n=1 Tax=uncultured Spirochaetota bacterium TaxID=460511 RepID=A0A652ZS32_9SPIR|nr:hypothetical protein TRIP_E110049 [uncultured Spirochaetota bacterium]